MRTPLCRSIDYASIPCEPDDTFNLRRVPILVYECTRYLKANGLGVSGIFRVNGSEKRINQLAGVFDSGPRYGHGFDFEGYTTYDVADLLKKYIRTLPEPLLTFELYPYFLKSLDTNQMTAKNLARILSPNILRPRNEKQALEEFQSCAFVLEFMIENHDQFRISSRDVKPFDILDVSYLPKRQPSLKKKQLVQSTPVNDTEKDGDISHGISVFLKLGKAYHHFANYMCDPALKSLEELPYDQYNTSWVLALAARCLFEKGEYKQVFEKKKKFEDAVKAYKQIEGTKEDTPMCKYRKACALTSLKRYDEALDVLLKLEEFDKPDCAVLFALGKVYKQLGNIDLALRYFTRAQDAYGPKYSAAIKEELDGMMV
ncbi:hypothetical protein HDU96_004789 [Phlyctochytrium bullatum]|nr:hypothetical protein HDU96_004789 [Phlyctochytrium bullatum]